MKISDVLKKVAKDYGTMRGDPSWNKGYRRPSYFLCHRIHDAMGGRRCVSPKHETGNSAIKFLADHGMPVSGGGFSFWHTNDIGHLKDELSHEERWGVRYAWLELMIQIAEEEGL